jgi:1-acyl-sn-glycerol-3-phosphate acyltransferase
MLLLNNALLRRLITVPAVLLAALVTTLLLPPLLMVAVVVDAFRAAVANRKAMASRGLVFLWVYLVGESWAVAALGAVALLGRRRSLVATYRLQEAWAGWNVSALRMVLGLEIELEGDESIDPGPLVILTRHVSLIDSLLPARLIANRHGFRLRYVLKRELLFDPALDIAGNRLPNYFVERRSGDSEAEVEAIRALALDLDAREGVVIFPEGTRFSPAKLARAVARSSGRQGSLASIAGSYRSVLPPRPAGTIALLENPANRILVLAHHGLEGLSGMADVWAGRLVGTTVSVGIWNVDRATMPEGRKDQIEWLYRTWAGVDEWIQEKERITGLLSNSAQRRGRSAQPKDS